MNLLSRINYIRALPVLLVILIFGGCKDENKAPVVTFDSAGKGAYIKLVAGSTSGGLLINILTQADFTASQYGYSVEFVDGAGGTRVSKYVLNIEYKDVTGANSAGPIELRSYESSSFAPAASGNLGVANIVVTSADVTSAFGLSYADLNAGDNFVITGSLVTDDGTFSSSNSSATVRGTAFQGFFDYTMPAGCPSDLTGTFDVVTDTWCGNTINTSVNIVSEGGGKYGFSDWSFGAYGDCYGGGSATGDFNFVEVCTVVTLNDGTDSYGDSWRFTSSISGNDWTIVWENYTYASGLENGTSTITFPSGVPFTLN